MTSSLLQWCLQAPTETLLMDSADSWLQVWHQLPFAQATPMALAVMGGFQADRPAWVFASGYQAALRSVFPGTAGPGLFAFCLTEEGGHGARNLSTTWSADGSGGIGVTGAKGWTPLFQHYSAYFVACQSSEHEPNADACFRVVRLPADTDGVSFEARTPGRFLPELPTARMQVQVSCLSASALLPGDGWSEYAKPFSAQEELYVTAALLAYLLREGRAHDWPQHYVQQLVGALSLLCSLVDTKLDTAIELVTLSGATTWARTLFAEASDLWQQSPDDVRATRWFRDKPIQTLWAGSSEKRGAKAWAALSNAG